MVKDADQYAADGGWAYGAWNGANLTAPPAADFDRGCVNCHVGSVAENDYVFTRPGALPARFTLAP
jgi:Cytochrome P460